MNISLLVKFLVLLAVVVGLVACGRPATEAECREILRRTAELELKDRLGNQQLIQEEIAAIEKSMRPEMMKKCVGKRITEDALKCVRAAKTSEAVSHGCFR